MIHVYTQKSKQTYLSIIYEMSFLLQPTLHWWLHFIEQFHSAIVLLQEDPSFAFESCMMDLCLSTLHPESLCRSLQAFADLCQTSGITVRWRSSTLCREFICNIMGLVRPRLSLLEFNPPFYNIASSQLASYRLRSRCCTYLSRLTS